MAVHAEILVPPIRRALIDPLEPVRESAAFAFDTLYAKIGRRALDEVLPDLLNRLESDDSSALDGLRQLVAVKSAVVLPYLIPKVIGGLVGQWEGWIRFTFRSFSSS